MPLMNRFVNLFTADVHAVLDRLEEPVALLRQAIRDMDEEIARMQTTLNLATSDNRRDEELLARERDLLGSVDEELDTCLAAGADDLARTLIRRKLEATRRAQGLNERLESRRQRASALAADLAGNRERLNAMQEKLALYAEREDSFDNDAVDPGVSSEDVEIALLREKERRARA